MTAPVFYLSQADGAKGVEQTLDMMCAIVRRSKKHPVIRTLAVRLVNQLPQKDYVNELRALHRFVRDNVRYTRDVRGVETLQYPEITVKERAGDCDDKSILFASLAESLNFPTRFVAVGYDSDSYCHVLPQVRVGRGWIPAETTEPVDLGWFPPNMKAKMIRHVKR